MSDSTDRLIRTLREQLQQAADQVAAKDRKIELLEAHAKGMASGIQTVTTDRGTLAWIRTHRESLMWLVDHVPPLRDLVADRADPPLAEDTAPTLEVSGDTIPSSDLAVRIRRNLERGPISAPVGVVDAIHRDLSVLVTRLLSWEQLQEGAKQQTETLE